MIKIEYNLTGYEEMFRYFAKCLQLKVTDHSIHFTPDKGNGVIKLVNLVNGLQVMIYDYTPYDSILYHRKKSDTEFYVLRLDESKAEDGVMKGSVFFGKTTQEWFYMVSANNPILQVNIIISQSWMDEYFEGEEAGEKLASHIALKSPLVIYDPIDNEYRRLINEMVYIEQGKDFERLVVQNRALLILERFFARLHKKIENQNYNIKISANELKAIKEVEQALLKDFSEPPPAISQLARIAAMSPSKLKILFKEVFGMPINQYYQKHRMNKAKAMLLSKRHSVRETANSLAFASVSSFNKTFYKAFEQLPAEIAIPENK